MITGTFDAVGVVIGLCVIIWLVLSYAVELVESEVERQRLAALARAYEAEVDREHRKEMARQNQAAQRQDWYRLPSGGYVNQWQVAYQRHLYKSKVSFQGWS